MSDFIYAKEINLKDLLEDKHQIPGFQRPFSWDEKNIRTILKDIYDAFKNKEIYEQYFVGAIYLVNKKNNNNENDELVIDGQQRITFFYLLMLIFDYNLISFEDSDFDNDLSKLRLKLEDVTKYEQKNNHYPNLSTHGFDKKILQKIFNWSQLSRSYRKTRLSIDILGEDIKESKDKFLYQKYAKAIDEINVFIKTKFVSRNNFLNFKNFINYVLNNVILLKIDFKEYKLARILDVFLQINNRGKKLDFIDIIKAYLFRTFKKENVINHEEICEEAWTFLLKETNNNLFEYIETVFKTFFKFIKAKIKFDDFRSFYKNFKDSLLMHNNEFYKAKDFVIENKKDIEIFIDYLKDPIKIKAYNILNFGFLDEGNNQTTEYKKKRYINLYLKLLKLSRYEHHKKLVYRSIYAYLVEDLDISSLLEIIKHSFRFLFTFQTINFRDSKDSIPPFQKMIKQFIKNNDFPTSAQMKKDFSVNFQYENLAEIEKQLKKNNKQGDRTDTIHKVILLLSNLEEKLPNLEDIEKAINKLEKTHHLDHIIPQKTTNSEKNYFVVERKNDEIKKVIITYEQWLNGRLANNEEVENNEVPKEVWESHVINNLGNLQLLVKEENMKVQNNDKKVFNSFEEIDKRAEDIINSFINCTLFK